jgi:hypothetical protein
MSPCPTARVRTRRPNTLTLRRSALVVVAAVTATAAGAPVVAQAGQPRPSLVVSQSPDRATAKPLSGSTLSPDTPVYVFVSGDERRRLVKFYLDDPRMTKDPVSTEKSAPFDLAGTTARGDARPVRFSKVEAGKHTLTARVKLKNGTNRVVTVPFTVGRSTTKPTSTTSPTSPATSTATVTRTSSSSTTSAVRSAQPTADGFTPFPSTSGATTTSAARPSTTTAGVRGSLKPSGSVTVTRAGAVIENLDVQGSITVRANDVTIRNVRVRAGGHFGINVVQGVHGTLIDHVDIEMSGDATAAIGGLGDHDGSHSTKPGDNVTVRYSHLHGNGDGIKAVNFGLYEHNYIHMRRPAGSVRHIDGIQSSGRSSWTARYNWVDQAYSAGFNSAIFVQAYSGSRDVPSKNITITNNWVNGALYTIQTEDGKNGNSGLLSNIQIDDNVFYRDYKYGAYRPRGDIRGNGGHWADSGLRVPTGAIK